jgi:cytochrome P450
MTSAVALREPESVPFPPTYRGKTLLESLRAFQSGPLAFLSRVFAEQGDVVQLRIGPRWVTIGRHPEFVEHVLVTNAKNFNKQTRGYRMLRKVLGTGLLTSEGELWRRQRRIAQPAFHKQRIASFADAMTRASHEMIDERWEAGREIDVSVEMMRVTLDIVSETLLGIESGERADTVDWTMPVILEHVVYQITHPLSPHEIVPTPRNLRFRRALKALGGIVGEIVAERRASGPRGQGDLLDMFMEMRDEETGATMSDRELRDEVMTMYLAGHETTANALGWTLYLLALHPEWETRVRAEVDRVLGGEPASFAMLPKLELVRRVIEESMRLYPPVWLIGRNAVADDVVMGYRIPKGRLTFVSPYLTHRDPKYWPEPERFDPDRFLPENARRRPKHAYIPFSTGQRKCIGDQFAIMEAQLVLATILQRARLTLLPDQNIVPQTAITLRPEHGIRMRIDEVRPLTARIRGDAPSDRA